MSRDKRNKVTFMGPQNYGEEIVLDPASLKGSKQPTREKYESQEPRIKLNTQEQVTLISFKMLNENTNEVHKSPTQQLKTSREPVNVDDVYENYQIYQNYENPYLTRETHSDTGRLTKQRRNDGSGRKGHDNKAYDSNIATQSNKKENKDSNMATHNQSKAIKDSNIARQNENNNFDKIQSENNPANDLTDAIQSEKNANHVPLNTHDNNQYSDRTSSGHTKNPNNRKMFHKTRLKKKSQIITDIKDKIRNCSWEWLPSRSYSQLLYCGFLVLLWFIIYIKYGPKGTGGLDLNADD